MKKLEKNFIHLFLLFHVGSDLIYGIIIRNIVYSKTPIQIVFHNFIFNFSSKYSLSSYFLWYIFFFFFTFHLLVRFMVVGYLFFSGFLYKSRPIFFWIFTFLCHSQLIELTLNWIFLLIRTKVEKVVFLVW